MISSTSWVPYGISRAVSGFGKDTEVKRISIYLLGTFSVLRTVPGTCIMRVLFVPPTAQRRQRLFLQLATKATEIRGQAGLGAQARVCLSPPPRELLSKSPVET